MLVLSSQALLLRLPDGTLSAAEHEMWDGFCAFYGKYSAMRDEEVLASQDDMRTSILNFVSKFKNIMKDPAKTKAQSIVLTTPSTRLSSRSWAGSKCERFLSFPFFLSFFLRSLQVSLLCSESITL